MINLKSIIRKGLEMREEGFELLGKTIQTAVESVGLGRDDERIIYKLPKDIAESEAVNKDFLAVFEKQNPHIKDARIIVNSKRWLENYQFSRLIEQDRQGIAVYKEGDEYWAEYLTFSQPYTTAGWEATIIKFSTSKSKIDKSAL